MLQRVHGFRLVYGKWEIFQDNHVLLVQNISCRTSVHDIYMVFSRHGTLKVVDILLPTDEESHSSAFIRYQHAGEAQKAMVLLHGIHVHGHRLIVQNAKFGRLMEMEPHRRERASNLASTVSVPQAPGVGEDRTTHPVQRSRARGRRPSKRAMACDHYYGRTNTTLRHRRQGRKSKIQSTSPSHRSHSPMELCSPSLSPPPGFSFDRSSE